MKTILFSSIALILYCAIVQADYTAAGNGYNKGDAYVMAIGSAPNGYQWQIIRVNYFQLGNGRYNCSVTWREK